MYTLLAADDEPIVLESLKLFIREKYAERYEMLEAGNGIDALRLILERRPDLALIDIEMPGLSGIEIIREARSHGFAGRFVILTAYGRFEYAQQAVSFGVSAYLLKPIPRRELEEVLDRCLTELDRAAALSDRLEQDQNKLKQALEFAQRRFFDALAASDLQEARQLLEQGVMGFNRVEGRIIALAGGPDATAFLSRIAESGPHDVIRCEPGPRACTMEGDVLLIWLNRISTLAEPDALGGFLFGTLILLEGRACGVTKCAARVGADVSELDDLAREFTGARAFRAGDRDFAVLEPAYRARGGSAGFKPLLRRLVRALREGEDEKRGRAIGMAAWKSLTQSYESPTLQIGALCALVRALVRALIDSGAAANAVRVCRAALVECARAEFDGETLIVCCARAALEQQRAGASGSAPIARAIEYMRVNFAQDISMADLADYVGFSEYHFSRMFKQETGENFVEALTKLRIAHAKSLIATLKLSPDELARLCGYNSTGYFSRVFKRTTGLTLSEYRQSLSQ